MGSRPHRAVHIRGPLGGVRLGRGPRALRDTASRLGQARRQGADRRVLGRRGRRPCAVSGRSSGPRRAQGGSLRPGPRQRHGVGGRCTGGSQRRRPGATLGAARRRRPGILRIVVADRGPGPGHAVPRRHPGEHSRRGVSGHGRRVPARRNGGAAATRGGPLAIRRVRDGVRTECGGSRGHARPRAVGLGRPCARRSAIGDRSASTAFSRRTAFVPRS